MARVQIVPVDRLRDLLDELEGDTLEAMEEQGMLRVVNVLEAKAVELAPVDTGNLEQSTVVTVRRRGGTIAGLVRFGAPYAATVHELPEDARGPKTRQKTGNEFGVAGPKYLERPLRGFQQRLARDLGEFLQEIWGGFARRQKAKGKRKRA